MGPGFGVAAVSGIQSGISMENLRGVNFNRLFSPFFFFFPGICREIILVVFFLSFLFCFFSFRRKTRSNLPWITLPLRFLVSWAQSVQLERTGNGAVELSKVLTWIFSLLFFLLLFA